MKVPTELRGAAEESQTVTIARREYDDENLIAVDFGGEVDAKLDVLGDTAIVVAADDQYEFAIPAEATDVRVSDGMLLIESE